MRIRWTPSAATDLGYISNHLKEHHPQYRKATLRKMYATIQSLKRWPERSRVGREEGTRELVFPPLPYVAVYRLKEEQVEVLRVYHGSRQHPKEQ